MKALVWLENEIAAFRVSDAQLERFRLRHVELSIAVARSREEFLKQLPQAELALVWRFRADWYPLATALRLVATPAAGREWIENDPSGRVPVRHGSFHGKIMAESLLAMLFFCARRLDLCVAGQEARSWDRNAFSTTRRLAGQQALIIGYGALGRECARQLKAVGLSVLGVKRSPTGDAAPADAVYPVSSLRELLPSADHVVLTLPGDTGTDQLLGAEELALLKRGACVFNLGRGNAIDEAALVRALSSGHVAHAFLDVFAVEPLPHDSPLWQTPNLHVMPHASAVGAEYLDLWLEELSARL
jgi:D-2-hydroxyacid dehydrogenase (NADP+)